MDRIASLFRKVGKESGFTLIELVMVIVIIGILAAVAIPKFLDLQTSARQAVVNGVAGELGAAAKANYAVCAAANNAAGTNGCTTITTCASIGTSGLITLPNDGNGTPITVVAVTEIPATPKNGAQGTCAAHATDGSTDVTFLGFRAGNP